MQTPSTPRSLSFVLLFALAIATLAPLSASACRVFVPLEVRLAQASYIVQGEIVDVVEEGRYQHGTLQVTDVMKGDPETRMLTVVWPAPRRGPGIIADGPLRYANGQKGLWILTPRKDIGLMAGYPGDFSPDAKAAEQVTTGLKTLAAIEWEKTGDLEWTVLTNVYPHKTLPGGKKPKSLARGEFYPVVRNVGDTEQNLFFFTPLQPLTATVKTPSGKDVAVNVGKGNPLAKAGPFAFRALQPGETTMLGYGMAFPPFGEPGKHTLSVTYKNADQDGTDFDKKNVFQGEVTFTAEVVVPEQE